MNVDAEAGFPKDSGGHNVVARQELLLNLHRGTDGQHLRFASECNFKVRSTLWPLSGISGADKNP